MPSQGGLVYYGGLVGGALAIWIFARRRRLPFVDLLDFVAPLGALGLASTRIGCFLNGCCFGRPSALPWAVSYPVGSRPQLAQAGLGWIEGGDPALPVHPVQLYEAVAAAALFALLWWWLYPRRRYAGQVVATFLLLYGCWRFTIEFLRADSLTAAAVSARSTGLTLYQVLSLALVAVATLGLLAARARSRPPFSVSA